MPWTTKFTKSSGNVRKSGTVIATFTDAMYKFESSKFRVEVDDASELEKFKKKVVAEMEADRAEHNKTVEIENMLNGFLG